MEMTVQLRLAEPQHFTGLFQPRLPEKEQFPGPFQITKYKIKKLQVIEKEIQKTHKKHKTTLSSLTTSIRFSSFHLEHFCLYHFCY
ncbi:uncharacterized protein LOC144627570 isoform X2 [Crassostrea virginica]